MIITKTIASMLCALTIIILIMLGTDDGSSKTAIIGGSLCILWLVVLGTLAISAIWGL